MLGSTRRYQIWPLSTRSGQKRPPGELSPGGFVLDNVGDEKPEVNSGDQDANGADNRTNHAELRADKCKAQLEFLHFSLQDSLAVLVVSGVCCPIRVLCSEVRTQTGRIRRK